MSSCWSSAVGRYAAPAAAEAGKGTRSEVHEARIHNNDKKCTHTHYFPLS